MIKKTKGNTIIYEKIGDYNQALEDFYSLNLKNVKKLNGGVAIGQLENGNWVNVHKSSEDMRHSWTLAFGKNKKIRYVDYMIGACYEK